MKSIIVLLIFILVVGFIWSMIKKWEKELLIEANELRQKKTNLKFEGQAWVEEQLETVPCFEVQVKTTDGIEFKSKTFKPKFWISDFYTLRLVKKTSLEQAEALVKEIFEKHHYHCPESHVYIPTSEIASVRVWPA